MNYLCVDFGGTKTLVCILDDEGKITTEVRFETPADYPDFIDQLAEEINALPHKFRRGVMSVPGLIDHRHAAVIALGNRPWTNIQIGRDIHAKTGVVLSLVNDARLAGLAETIELSDDYSRVLYLTVSTGIGGALAIKDKLVQELDDIECGKMPLWYDGTLQPWEEFASGRAIFATYNQRASDINDETIWREIAHKLALGVAPLCTILYPQAIVFGGGAGMQADKFKHFLIEELDHLLHPVVRKPEALFATKLKDEAVIYGCYHYARQHHKEF